MNIGLYEDADTANAVKLDFHLRVIPPVTHLGHVLSSRLVLFVS